MKKLKAIQTFAALCLLASVTLSGCGTSGAASGSASGGAQSASAKPAEAGEPVTIEYWHINSKTFGGPTIDQYAQAFNKCQSKYKVVPRFIEGVYGGVLQNLQADTAAGNPPAVIQVGYSYLDYFSKNFKYTSPADLIQNDSSVSPDYLKGFKENTLKLSTAADGTLVGLPYSLSVPVMYYNLDILKKAGVDTEKLPTTWDQVYSAAKQISDKTKSTGLVIQCSKDFWLGQCMIESNGGSLAKTADGKMQASFASAEGVEAMQQWADAIKNGSTKYILNEESKSAFMSGNVGILAASIGWSSAIDSGSSFQLVTTKMPAYGQKPLKAPAGGNFLTITAQSEEKKKGAWEWVKYLTSAEGYLDWTKGTGYIPPRTDVLESSEFKDYLKKNPLLQAAAETVDYANPWISFSGSAGMEADQKLLDMRDAVMNGKQTAAKALPATQDEINQMAASKK